MPVRKNNNKYFLRNTMRQIIQFENYYRKRMLEEKECENYEMQGQSF
jgi:hypothetical protein